MYNKNAKCSVYTLPQPEKDKCIYLLIDPRDDQPKYIGLTTRGFSRIRSHYLTYTKENTRKVNWVKKLISLNLIFKVQYLEYCETEDQLKIAEAKWIKHYTDLGFKLLNHTAGGENVYRRNFSLKERQEMSIKHKLIAQKPEVKLRMSLAHLGKPSCRKGKKITKEQLEFITKRNREVSGIKVVDQYGNVYPSVQELSKILKCSMNTIRDRLTKNPDKPLKGLILKRV